MFLASEFSAHIIIINSGNIGIKSILRSTPILAHRGQSWWGRGGDASNKNIGVK